MTKQAKTFIDEATPRFFFLDDPKMKTFEVSYGYM